MLTINMSVVDEGQDLHKYLAIVTSSIFNVRMLLYILSIFKWTL